MSRFSFTQARGFSLIELMIAVALGLTLIGLVLPVFLGNIQSFNFSSGIARSQESAGAAFNELARDIRMLGYSGCNSKNLSVINRTANSAYDLVPGLVGYDNVSQAGITGIDASLYSIPAGTDAITVKYLRDANVLLAGPVAASADRISVRSGHTLKAGDIIFVGDCESGVINQVKSVTDADVTMQVPLMSQTPYGISAQVYTVEAATYFLAASKIYINNRDQVPTSLWRQINGEAPRELVVGVDALQLLYGLDTDNDGAANIFKSADALAGQMQKVATVRLQMITNSIDAVGTDGVISRPLSLSISLRNKRSG